MIIAVGNINADVIGENKMLYQKAKIENGQMVITESKVIDQSKLTSDCWLIQFGGLSACENCPAKDTSDCGGQAIRGHLILVKHLT